jgi:hypothetical protein
MRDAGHLTSSTGAGKGESEFACVRKHIAYAIVQALDLLGKTMSWALYLAFFSFFFGFSEGGNQSIRFLGGKVSGKDVHVLEFVLDALLDS